MNYNTQEFTALDLEFGRSIVLFLVNCRYDLLDRFKAVVKGFANCHEFIKVHCAQTMVTYSLKTLAKILLDKEPKRLHDAFERAKLVHEVS